MEKFFKYGALKSSAHKCPQTDPKVFDFKKLWKESKDEALKQASHQKTTEGCHDLFADIFFEKVKSDVVLELIEVDELVTLLDKRITRTLNDKSKKNRNRKLSINSVLLLLSENTNNTNLVRHCLTTLYTISHHIDREIFLFEHHKENNLEYLPTPCRDYIRQRREQILRHVGGWRVPISYPWKENHEMTREELYLELPYRRAHNQSNSHLMAEALYREQDPEFALLLLRHGVPASFLYLWPVCILIDLKQTLHNGIGISPNSSHHQIQNSDEAKMIRYFCRARHFVHVHLVLSPNERDFNGLTENDNLEDCLMLPPAALKVLPKDRYEHPSSLMHQCRLVVRHVLLDNDRLPIGIAHLPVPQLIRDFIDLLED